MSNEKNGNDEKSERKLHDGLSSDPVISNRYEIKRVIGGGVNSTVFEAYDKSLRKAVAIKKLHSASSSAELIRFQREAKLTSSLTHPNVRSVLDFGLTAENEPYLVLELAQGENVADYLKQHGQMELETTLDILIQVAAGLEHAHNRSIIHRDIKPSNVILVERDNRLIAQIVDFGIAKSQTSIQDITGEGVGLGTPLFMSPEQVRNSEIDQRSDIYSFGCLMYHMLTGQPPFVGATALDTIKMHTDSPLPALIDKSDDEFSESLEQIVNKALAKNPADRYSSIKELSSDLESELHRLQILRAETSKTDSPIQSDSEPSRYGAFKIDGMVPMENSTRKPGKRAILAIVAGGLVAAVGCVLLVGPTFFPTTPPPSQTEGPKPSDPFHSYFGTPTNFYVTTQAWAGDEKATDADLAKLASHGGYVQRINLSSSPLITGAGLKVLQNTNVLYFTYTDHDVDEEALRNISKIKSITRLKLGGTNKTIDTKALSLLQDLPKLLEIYLYGVEIDDTALASIVKCKKIVGLGFESGRGMDKVNWELLNSLNRFDNLNLNDTDLGDAGLIKISALRKLRSIFIKGTNVSDAGISRLMSSKLLHTVDVTGCRNVSSACLKKLKDKGFDVYSEARVWHKHTNVGDE